MAKMNAHDQTLEKKSERIQTRGRDSSILLVTLVLLFFDFQPSRDPTDQ
jgi:hypothetical protein